MGIEDTSLDHKYSEWSKYLKSIKISLEGIPNLVIELDNLPLDKYSNLTRHFNQENGYNVQKVFYNKGARGDFKIKLKISKLEKI